MKILKYLLIAVVALVLIFLAIGLMKPSVNYGHEIEVTKSVKEAWAVSQDESKLGQWLDGFKSIELLSGEKGAVGSTYKVVVNPGEGQEDFEMIETIISFEEFEHVKLSFESEMMDFVQTTSFSENNGVTKVKTDSEVKGKGMMMRSTFATMEMLMGAFTKQEAKNIDALQKVIDENTTDYFPAPEPVVEEQITEEVLVEAPE